tara:strand:+ start:1147 stop:2001 length:855 start_codon:yes stop_codon:yes gene_type:complete
MRDPVFTIDWDVDFDGLRNEVSEYVKDEDIKLMTKERALSMGAALPTEDNSTVKDVNSYSAVSPYDAEKQMWLPVLKKHKEQLQDFLQVPMEMGSSYTIQNPHSSFALHTDIMASIFFKDRNDMTEWNKFLERGREKENDLGESWLDLQIMINRDAADQDDISKNIVDNLYRWCVKWDLLEDEDHFERLISDDFWNKWMDEAPRASINIVLDEQNANNTAVSFLDNDFHSFTDWKYRCGVLNVDRPHVVSNKTDSHRIMARFTTYRMTHKEVYDRFEQANFKLN